MEETFFSLGWSLTKFVTFPILFILTVGWIITKKRRKR